MSRLGTMEPPSCKNVRSRRHPDQKCTNPAVHGEYCGLHHKHPNPFKSKARLSMDETPVNTIVVPMDACAPVVKLQRWWRFWSSLAMLLGVFMNSAFCAFQLSCLAARLRQLGCLNNLFHNSSKAAQNWKINPILGSFDHSVDV